MVLPKQKFVEIVSERILLSKFTRTHLVGTGLPLPLFAANEDVMARVSDYLGMLKDPVQGSHRDTGLANRATNTSRCLPPDVFQIDKKNCYLFLATVEFCNMYLKAWYISASDIYRIKFWL